MRGQRPTAANEIDQIEWGCSPPSACNERGLRTGLGARTGGVRSFILFGAPVETIIASRLF